MMRMFYGEIWGTEDLINGERRDNGDGTVGTRGPTTSELRVETEIRVCSQNEDERRSHKSF